MALLAASRVVAVNVNDTFKEEPGINRREAREPSIAVSCETARVGRAGGAQQCVVLGQVGNGLHTQIVLASFGLPRPHGRRHLLRAVSERIVETAEDFIARKKAAVVRQFETKDIGRKGRNRWFVEAATYRTQSNLREKVFVIERLRLVQRAENTTYPGGAQVGNIEYRFGYYTIAPASGRWWWGQYSPLIPAEDLGPLLAQARAEGTLLVGQG